MATTYKIKNIVPNLETNTMVVFYEFSTGDIFSNIVPISTTITKMKSWGQAKCTWFDQREIDIEQARIQLIEQPIVEVVEEITQ